jgi:hypothetical protein
MVRALDGSGDQFSEKFLVRGRTRRTILGQCGQKDQKQEGNDPG